MLYYLIVCRSLTYAQRPAAAPERAGIGDTEAEGLSPLRQWFGLWCSQLPVYTA